MAASNVRFRSWVTPRLRKFSRQTHHYCAFTRSYSFVLTYELIIVKIFPLYSLGIVGRKRQFTNIRLPDAGTARRSVTVVWRGDTWRLSPPACPRTVERSTRE